MKNKPGIFLLFMIMLVAGCKTTVPATGNISRTMILQIQNNGNIYDGVMDVIRKQTQIRSVNIADAKVFPDYYQQMQVEINFLSSRQVSILQTELSRIPGVITVNYF